MSSILKEVIETSRKILKEVGIEANINADNVLESKLVLVVRRLHAKYGRPCTKGGMGLVWREFRKEERSLWANLYGTSVNDRRLQKISFKNFCRYYNSLASIFIEESKDGE